METNEIEMEEAISERYVSVGFTSRIEKDVFRLIASVGPRKNSESP